MSTTLSHARSCLRLAAAVAGFACSIACAQAGAVDVLTHHYDNARTGLNAKETRLTPSNVNGRNFGKLFSHPVDGAMFGQPLYASRLAIPGKGAHNVVFVATENDSVYAFDADNAWGTNTQALWQASLVDAAHGAAPGATPMPDTELGTDANGYPLCSNIHPNVGITSTPVIDKASQTIYVVAKSKESGSIVHRLHALDLTTGLEKDGSPVAIPGSMLMPEAFDPVWHVNRPALLLDHGTVYVAFGSHCDGLEVHPYRGWMFSFDAHTLAPKAVLPVTRRQANAGSIWMSGAGPAADAAGQVFATSGDGDYDGVGNFSDSVLKLDGASLHITDWFSPPDNTALDAVDADLGSGGALLLPDQPGAHPHLLVQATKDGRIYLLDRDDLGRFCTGCDGGKVVQVLGKGTLGAPAPAGFPSDWLGYFGVPTYWNQKLYFWANNDVLKVYSLRNGLLDPAPQSGPVSYGYPGAVMTISANGQKAGIVWSVRPGDKAALQAWDANSLSLLYSSDVASDDAMGPAARFAPPIVANGKVFVPGNQQLSVYGRRIKLGSSIIPLY